MKQGPMLIRQVFEIAELRQQIAGLEAQNKKLATDIKNLRDTDRKIFDEQDKQIADLKELVRDWQQYVRDDDEIDLGEHFDAEWEAGQEQRAKLEQRTKELIKKE
jgi:hypothetical protein